MENTTIEKMDAVLASQKTFFRKENTLNVDFRKEQLKKLLNALESHEKELADALWQDLHKSYEEAYLTEISIVKAEIREAIKHVKKWARRERHRTPITLFGSRSYIVKEPLGSALIVSPWNYPVQLLLNPLVGAIAAGCTAILKPSPYVPHVSSALEKMIKSAFSEEYIAVAQGNREVNKHLFSMKFDMIFFTGSPALARHVAAAAAENLVPMVLELGGKSPCIIDKSADIKLAAKRCAWGKTLNAGQTCIAPDYILIHQDVKDKFVQEFAKAIKELHGDDIINSKHFVRMVTDKAFERVSSYLSEGKIVYGGHTDAQQRFIEPTLLDNIRPDADVLTTEIFGPVFPLITINDSSDSFENQVVNYINDREKPLALYYFGNEKQGWNIVRRTSSGGCCLNDTIMHIANGNLPFGGVGNSGMGHYHGILSFEAFSHRRSVVASPTLFDLPFRYMPYKMFGMVKKIM
ncbi:MAG: aldehyde dehydrogenase family protein [Bacteroidales bacterium]|nr:aldehyde dehydrogenase family protein [Bacteroidales bacterium]